VLNRVFIYHNVWNEKSVQYASMSTVAVHWNTTQWGISVYRLAWVLSECGAVSGLEIILLRICSGKL